MHSAVLGIVLATAILGTAAEGGAGCTAIGGSVLCGNRLSQGTVGRSVIFPQGPAGERDGDFVAAKPGDLPGPVVGEAPGPAAPESRPLDRPDRLTDPRHGSDFGAFEFGSPAPRGLSPTTR
jgi:hypothetical protein